MSRIVLARTIAGESETETEVACDGHPASQPQAVRILVNTHGYEDTKIRRTVAKAKETAEGMES